MEIKNKVAIVSGAASGIGRAVALELVKRGVTGLGLVDRSPAVMDVAAELNDAAGRTVAIGFVGDTTSADLRHSAYEQVASRFGIVRICVPAAGITRDALAVRVDRQTGTAQIYPEDHFRLVMNVNLVAPTYWALDMVARIAEDRHQRGLGRWTPDEHVQGTIIFIGSVSSQGNKGQISYAATKRGLEGVAATLTKEAMFHGVRAGVIHPGFTDTPMVRALGTEYVEKYILPFTQLHRLIQPQEIADGICFMISNSAISGELWADAGWHPSA